MKTIKGYSGVTYHGDDGSLFVPFDLSEWKIEAILSQGEDELRWTGRGEPDGTFTVRARDTEVLVGLEDEYVSARGDVVDYRWDSPGRPGALWPAEPISLRLQLLGLAPWSGFPWLEAYSTNLGVYSLCFLDEPPDDGATALLDVGATWYGPLVEPSRRDRLVLLQSVPRTSELGCEYETPGKMLHLGDIEMREGVQTLLAGGMTDVPMSTLRLAVARSQFAALEGDVHPDARFDWARIDLAARPPGGFPARWSPDASIVSVEAWGVQTDLDCGAIDHGDPYPAAWQRYVFVSYEFVRDVVVDEAQELISATVVTTLDAATLAEGTVVPLVGPPLHVRIDGEDASVDRAIGDMPVVSWDPPAVGTATAYEVQVRRFRADATYPGFYTEASLYTASSSLTIPTLVLRQGERYVIAVSAIHAPNVDPIVTPYREELPYGLAEALTGLLTIQ